jgi:Mce-associated membrane protein
LAEAAEAEAVAAEAGARAAAARARAIRLRQQAGRAPAGCESTTTPGDGTADGESARTIDAPAPNTARPGDYLRRRPTRKALAVGAAAALLVASLSASGYMVWHHRISSQERHRKEEFASAARQAVVTLMSLDSNKTKEDIQHIADISTGKFKDRFPMVAAQLNNGLQQSKVVTTVTVNDIGVETMTDHSAVVLIAATTNAKKPDGTQDPGFWHIAMGLTEDAGQPKISNVEFVQ